MMSGKKVVSIRFHTDCREDMELYTRMKQVLHNSGTKEAEILRDKLYFLTAHNVFIPGNDFYVENKINIFRLSRYDIKT